MSEDKSLAPKQLPEILGVKQVAATRLFHIEEVGLKFANGEVRQYERLGTRGQGAVMMVAMPDADQFLLVREYAVGIHGYELSLPKGLIDSGESVIETSNRELQEELGYAAATIQPVSTLLPAPGYLSSKMHVVFATDLYPSVLEGDEPEPLEVVPWRFSELPALLARDDFNHAASIAALFLVREMLHQLPLK